MSLTVRKKSLARALRLGIIFIALLAALGAVFYSQLAPAQPANAAEVLFTVKNGATPTMIAQQLEQEGLIKNAQVFLVYARLSGDLNKFKAGQYFLKASARPPEIMDILVRAPRVTGTLSIPQREQLRPTTTKMFKQGITTEAEFWRVVKEADFPYEFIQGLPKSERRLEGYLFPDTYSVPKGWETEKVIDVMLKRFDQVYKKLPPNKSGLNMQDTVILASIVEGESKVDQDRPKIASVFLNRLKVKMPLQADATLQYAFGERKERVLYKDLELDDPYNTYKYGGLTPGPIGSPGEASLRAVCHPAKSDFPYFVAKKDANGEHEVAADLADHEIQHGQAGH